MAKLITKIIKRPCLDLGCNQKCKGKLVQFIQLLEWDVGCWSPYVVTVCLECESFEKEELNARER